MEPTIVEVFDISFDLCNSSSGNRNVGITDMVRVLIQNLVWILKMLESRLPKQFFQLKNCLENVLTYFTNSLKVLVKFIEFYKNIFEGVHM